MTFDFRVVEVRSALKEISRGGVQTEPTCFLQILKKHTMEVSALAFAMDLTLTLCENLGKTVHVDTYIMQHLGPGPDWTGDEQAESEDRWSRKLETLEDIRMLKRFIKAQNEIVSRSGRSFYFEGFVLAKKSEDEIFIRLCWGS